MFSFLAFEELGETDLERKISLCMELLEIAEVLEPGMSLFRGKLLLDLLPALMGQTRGKLQNGIMNKHEAKVLAEISSQKTHHMI